MRLRISPASLLGHSFWLPALIAMAAGLWLPGDFRALGVLVPVSLGGILYFTALKVEPSDVARQFRAGSRLIALAAAAFVKLVALPLGCVAIARVVAPDWALGVLIVMAMPAGMASSAMADLYRADVPFVLALTLLTSVLCPVSVPLLAAWFDPGATFAPAVLGARAGYIVLLLTVPFALAQITRRLVPDLIERHRDRWSMGSVVCTCALIFISIASNRTTWAAYGNAAFVAPLAVTSVLMAAIAALGSLARRHAIASTVDGLAYGCLWMNNGLAIAFSNRFFHGNATAMLPAVMIQLPIVASVAGYGSRALRERALTSA